MASTPSGGDAPSLERRIAQLESSLGFGVADPADPASHAKTQRNPRDVHSRIDLLLMGAGCKSGSGGGGGGKPSPPSSESLSRELKLCDRLVCDLDPGSLLTHQSAASASSSSASVAASAAPLLYRRQEVLASRDRLGGDLERLGRVRDLLLLALSRGEKGTATGGDGKLSAAAATSHSDGDEGRRFLDAPLLSSNAYGYSCDPDALRKLEAVSSKVADLRGRADGAASRVDDLLGRYRSVMAAMSEKLVMADEELVAAGR